MNGVDIFYSVNLSEVFCLTHPLGTVLGHAKYGNFMCFSNNEIDLCIYATDKAVVDGNWRRVWKKKTIKRCKNNWLFTYDNTNSSTD